MGIDITGKIAQYEYFKGNKIPLDIGFIVRLDGSNFSKFTEIYKKPFDKEFQNLMAYISKNLFNRLTEAFEVTTHSDEISIYFNKETEIFNRRHEKIVSEISGMASSLLSMKTGKFAYFDARVILMPTKRMFDEYRKDRWLDAFRGCVNSVSYWGLRQENKLNKRQATKKLKNLTSKQKQELIFQEFGINVAQLPAWQKQGLRFKRIEYKKEGYNPLTMEKILVMRNRIEEVEFPQMLS